MELIKKTLIFLLEVTWVLVALFIGAAFYDQYKKAPIEEFCAGIKKSQKLDEVIAAANSSGFVVLDSYKETGYVTILNHRAFAFRYGCNIETDGIKANGSQFGVVD